MSYLQISPSILNSFLNLKTGKYKEWGKGPEHFISEILHPKRTNKLMSRGKAYGLLFEHGPERYGRKTITPDDASSKDGAVTEYVPTDDPDTYIVHEPEGDITWKFTPAVVAPVIEFRGTNPSAVYELPAKLDFIIDGQRVVSRMKLDAVSGLHGYEFKTSNNEKEYMDRWPSAQKDLYMMAFPEMVDLTYGEFQFMKRGRTVRPVYRTYLPWAGMEAHISGLMRDCVRWLQNYPEVIKFRTRDEE